MTRSLSLVLALLWTLSLQAAPSAVSGGYVGATTCEGCHAAEYEQWQDSHHDLAMEPANGDTVLGDFSDATFDYFGTVSTFSRKDERYIVRTDGPDGKLTDFPIAYTFGVYPLQQYLIELPGGRLQALSIVWDSRPEAEGGQRWYHLYPEEPIRAGDELHWTGLNQNWNFMCADCHSTNLQKNYDLDTATYDTTWSEIDVACEACHGPGKTHVVAVQNDNRGLQHGGFKGSLSRAEPRAWAIDPKTGNPQPWSHGPEAQPELEVCAQCHSRRATQFHGARPQDGLFNHFMPSLLEEGLYHVDGQIDGEVFVYGSFVQSKMYHAGVTCSDCHNPHSLDLKAEGNAVCGQCHQASKYDAETHHGHPQDSAGAQCVNCHMPEKTYMGVDDRRDHSFRIPRPDLSVALGVPNTCNQCHTEKEAQWAAAALEKRHGPPPTGHFAKALQAGRYGGNQAETLLSELILDTTQPAIARATAVSLLPRYLSGQSAAVLQQASRSEEPLVALGAAQALNGIPERYRPMFGLPGLYDQHRVIRSLVASNLPPNAVPANPPELSQRYDAALADYIQSQLNNADRPESLVNLGGIYWQLGEPDNVEAYYRKAIEQAPYYTPAYVNLADFLRSQGDDVGGRKVLEQALPAVTDPAPIQHSLGLLLVRQQQTGDAMPYLRKAAESPSATARYVYVYAVALNSSGQTRQAIDVLESAYPRFPGNAEILSALASFYRSLGLDDEAQRYEKLLRG
ncbi:tetratricopeptide repeat protein [Marinobacter fonticola]|uniref:tetratricopeptide repeat protein n=1 Tax=Marinobacter fonticola TaxID=2603215 RepID=UPI001D0D871B|nr:multiheme c-type cytochrome [Marinobacter fonticola]